jgi:hypothetical protein
MHRLNPGIILGALVRAVVAMACFGYGVALAAEPSADTTEIRCEARNVSVASAEATDLRLACQGARDAVDFLAAQGLDATGEVAIDLVRILPDAADLASAGVFLESEGRVVVVTFAEFLKFKTWFELAIDASLYRSLVAHEVAHAIAAANFKVPSPSIQAKEYIAYVTMLATMDPEVRQRVLSHSPNHGFEGDWQMSSTIYMLDPMRFAVRAYRHFLKPGNGGAYLQHILSGEVMVE